LSDPESCKKARFKFQALLLAANCSEIEGSGEIVGDYLKSIAVALNRGKEMEQSEIIGVPQGWRVSFPEVFVPKNPGDKPDVYVLRFIEYTHLAPVLPTTLDSKLYCCELCVSRWCFLRSWWMLFVSLSLCPVCAIFRVPRSQRAGNMWDRIIDFCSSFSFRSVFRASNIRVPETTNNHYIIDIPLSGATNQLITDIFPQRDRDRAGTF
jgi:hypothetical protein